jgi:hypothetical protein
MQGPQGAGPVPLQRVILSIGAASEPGGGFPAMAARLWEMRGLGKVNSFNTYTHQAGWMPGFLRGLLGTKEDLYIVAHGSPGGISGFGDPGELAAALARKNLTSQTLSRIILVACSTGSGAAGTGGSFGLNLARLTGVPVYCSNKPIRVQGTDRGDFQAARIPERFTIDDVEVEIVGGAGLNVYNPTDTELKQSLL